MHAAGTFSHQHHHPWLSVHENINRKISLLVPVNWSRTPWATKMPQNLFLLSEQNVGAERLSCEHLAGCVSVFLMNCLLGATRCRPAARHNTVLLIVFGRRTRSVPAHPAHPDAWKRDRDRERNSQCICSLLGFSAFLLSAASLVFFDLLNADAMQKIFLCVIAVRGNRYNRKVVLLYFWLLSGFRRLPFSIQLQISVCCL